MGCSRSSIKPGFTKLIKIDRFCGVIHVVIHLLLGVQFFELQVQFRHFLQQLIISVPQLLKYVVGNDARECCKCYGDRGVPNC